MRKGKTGRKFGLKRDARRTLLRSLAEALIRHEHVSITEARAKELRPFIERWVTRARTDTIFNRRMVARYFTPSASKKLVDEIAPRYRERKGGYTRIIKREPRRGDGARRAIIEFVK